MARAFRCRITVELDFENGIHYREGVEVAEMYVCVCRAVTDKAVEAAIDAGADTVDAVGEACCAGEDCGACRDTIEEMVAERRGKRLSVVRAA
jgi:bacterioferritin-associated ferredoxin